MNGTTRLYFRAAILCACLVLCGTALGQEPGTGFLYAGKWTPPPLEKRSAPYHWPSWSGPRSSYQEPVDGPTLRYDETGQYTRNRVDRRLHITRGGASNGRIGLTLWSQTLMGTHRKTTDLVFGGLFVGPPRPDVPSNDSRWVSILSVPIDFYGAFDFTPSLEGGFDGADAPIAHGIFITTTPGVGDGRLGQLQSRVQGDRDPLHQIIACIEPSPGNVSSAVGSLEHSLSEQRSKGTGKHDLIELGWFHRQYTHHQSKAFWCFERAYQDLAGTPELQGAAALHYGLALEDAGRSEEAKQVYLKLLRTFPEDFWTTDALARLEGLGVPIASLRPGLPAEGEAGTRRYLRAFAEGDYAAALKHYRAVSAANPRDPWSRLYEGYLLRLQHDQGRAEKNLEIMRNNWPPYAEALELLGAVCLGLDENSLGMAVVARLRRRSAISVTEPLPFLLARVRDRTIRFPEDSLARILRAQTALIIAPYNGGDGRQIGLDSAGEYRRAIELAPRSWALRLYAFNYHDLDRRPQEHRLGIQEVAEHAETLLRLKEPETWGLHGLLAEVVYSPALLNRPEAAQSHRRRYKALKRRNAPGTGHGRRVSTPGPSSPLASGNSR